MDLRQIRYFVAVAESKSLTRAVDRLDVAQPALSLNIKSLEQELDAQLFNRSQRGMELTDAGGEFLNHAYGILRQVAQAQRSVNDLERDPHGSVAVAMPPSLSHALTVPLFNYVNERFPRIELDLEEGLQASVLPAFERGQFDLLVHFDIPRSKSRTITPIFREHLYLISPLENGGESNGSDVSFRELARHPILKPSDRNTLGALLARHAAKQGIELKGPPIHTPYHQTMLLIKAGITSAVLPYSAVHDLVGKSVTARKIVRPAIRRDVGIIAQADRAQSFATQQVAQAIKSVVTQLWQSRKWRGDLLIESDDPTDAAIAR